MSYKVKRFSIFDGNRKLREAIFKGSNTIEPWIKETFSEVPKDLQEYITVLDREDVSGNTTITLQTGVIMYVSGLNSLEKQVQSDYHISGWRYQNAQERRLIIIGTNYGSNDYVISYYPDEKTYKITKESIKIYFLNRAVNYIFGDRGIQVVKEIKTLKEGLNFINNQIRVIAYSDTSEKPWAETENQKKKRRKAAGTLAGTVGTLGTTIGIASSNPIDKKSTEKVAKIMMEENLLLDKVNAADQAIRQRGGNPQYDRFMKEKVMPELKRRGESTNKAVDKMLKIGNKRTNKKLLKNAGIGTAIGAGVGTVLALNASKGMKQQNESRNKKKWEKKHGKVQD